MLGKMLGRTIALIALLTVIAAVPISIWQRHRALDEIETVSQRFVVSASKLDLVRLRDSLTKDGREAMPAYFICVAAKKLAEVNRHVRIGVRTKVLEIKISGGEATARIKRDVTERGTRLGKPVNNRFADECTVICSFDGERWLVDLDRTVKTDRFPIKNMSIFKECLPK